MADTDSRREEEQTCGHSSQNSSQAGKIVRNSLHPPTSMASLLSIANAFYDARSPRRTTVAHLNKIKQIVISNNEIFKIEQ